MSTSYQYQIPECASLESKCRKGMRDVFHAYMIPGVSFDERFEMPKMAPETMVPSKLIPFSEAKNRCPENDSEFVHFYEYDQVLECFWNSPKKYMERLGDYAGFISPDFSTFPDMPLPLRQYNVYRNQLMGAWLQALGYRVICNVRCPAISHDYFLAGVPHSSLLAIGEVGCVQRKSDRHRFEGGLIRIVDELNPKGLIVYGGDSYSVFDHVRERGVELYFYPGKTHQYYKGVA